MWRFMPRSRPVRMDIFPPPLPVLLQARRAAWAVSELVQEIDHEPEIAIDQVHSHRPACPAHYGRVCRR